MGMFRRITLIWLLSFGVAEAAPPPWLQGAKVGLEFGGSADFLFSDIPTGAFGVGLGTQYGIFGTLWNDRPIGLKLRYDRVSLKEWLAGRVATNDLATNTYLRSMEQGWNMFSAGAEGRRLWAGQQFFWEASLGYASAYLGAVEVGSNAVDSANQSLDISARSTFYVGGGAGFRRELTPQWVAVISMRTFFLTGSTYTGALENRAYIPFPLLMSLGVEYVPTLPKSK